MTIPSFLNDGIVRYETEVELSYVEMRREEVLSAADSDGIAQIRVIDIPSQPNSALTADLQPKRLSLAIVDDRVVRAAFF